MNKILKNSPMVESIVDFRFNLESNDPTLIGLFFAEVSKDYPNRKTRKHHSIDNKNKNVEIFDLVQLINKDESMIIQIGGNLFTISFVKEYKGWDYFKSQIEILYSKYISIFSPSDIKRIAFRCINKINVPKGGIEFKKYFKFAPIIPNNLSGSIESYSIVLEDLNKIIGCKLSMRNMSVLSSVPEHLTLMLDLEIETLEENKISLDFQTISEWLDISHDELYDAFINSFTDEQIESFK